MKDYSSISYKRYAYKTDHVGGYSKGVSKLDKLTVRNINRSIKKIERQRSKKQIKEMLADG